MLYFMKIDGVTGGANYLGTDAWSTADSISFTMQGDLVVQRKLDFVSPKFAEMELSGTVIPQVWIDIVDSVGCRDYLIERITLNSVIVVSVSINSSSHQQILRLNFEKISKEYHDIVQANSKNSTSQPMLCRDWQPGRSNSVRITARSSRSNRGSSRSGE